MDERIHRVEAVKAAVVEVLASYGYGYIIYRHNYYYYYYRTASAAIESGDDFSRYSIQALDNYDNFDQTIMNMEVSQVQDPIRQAPQPANLYGASTEETGNSHRFTPLTCN